MNKSKNKSKNSSKKSVKSGLLFKSIKVKWRFWGKMEILRKNVKILFQVNCHKIIFLNMHIQTKIFPHGYSKCYTKYECHTFCSSIGEWSGFGIPVEYCNFTANLDFY